MRNKRSLFVWRFAAIGFCIICTVGAANGNPAAKKTEAAVLMSHWNREAVRSASDMFVSAAAELIKQQEFAEAASSLREAAKAFLILNEPKRAESSLRRSMQFDARIGNHEGLAVAAAYLTLTLLRTNNVKSAKLFAESSAEESEFSGSIRGKALSKFVEAEVAYKSRDFDRMTRLQETALDLYRQAGDKRGEAEILTYLSYTYTMSNRRHDGLAAAEAAVAILRETTDRRGLAFALIATGDASGRIGKWSHAYSVLREAQSYFPEALDQNENAMLHDRLAVYFETYGDSNQAREHYKKALSLFNEVGDPIGVSELCSALADLESQAGNIDAALAYIGRSSELAKRARDPISIGMAEESFGRFLVQKGAYDEAADRFEAAIKRYKQIDMKQLIAGGYSRLGNVYRVKGDLEQARRLFQEALQIGEKIESYPIRAEALFHLADIESDPATALELVNRSLELTTTLYEEGVLSNLRIKFNSVHRERHDLKVKVLMEMFRRSNDATFLKSSLVASEALRSRVLRENFILADTSVDADDAELRALESIRKKLVESSDNLTDALSRGSDTAEINRFERESSDLENQLDETRAKLRQKSPRYSMLRDPPPFNVADFQNTMLDDDSLLLEYFLGEKESYLWIVGKSHIEAFVLPAREQIESAVDEVLQVLNARRPIPGEPLDVMHKRFADADVAYPTAARKLSDATLGPATGKLSGKRLIVVPDGKLHLVGISSLPMPGGGDLPILLTNEVIYQPSAQVYTLLKKVAAERASERKKNLLVFSDPVFNPEDERLLGVDTGRYNQQYRLRLVDSFSSLSRLPASKIEAETVSNTVGDSDAFTGFAATRERLLSSKLEEYRVVHLATHGFLDSERPELSSLVFSRYDQTGKRIDESVRMHDIYSMNLHADLVVLSACQTGTGKVVRGEGVMGLNSAFLQAGAKSVVSTLWSVEDNAANHLMREFYDGMVSDRMSPSAALRAAQMKLYKDPQFRSPFFWAAFTIHGDAATVTPFKRDNTPLACGISAAALVFGVIGLMLRRIYRTSKV